LPPFLFSDRRQAGLLEGLIWLSGLSPVFGTGRAGTKLVLSYEH
jgi:hypothetical protein